MSRVLKSDKLKAKKQESQELRSDVTLNKNALSTKHITSRAIKTPTHLNRVIPAIDEKGENKTKLLLNAASTTTNNIKVGDGLRRKASASSQQKHVPLRAKQLTSTSNAVKEANQKYTSPSTSSTIGDKKPVYRKQNPVLDTPQNVTVCSPPPKKKNDNSKVTSNGDKKIDNSKLTRRESRILAPDEVIVLKRESAKRSIEKKMQESSPIGRTLTIGLKEPVAFEIQFEDKAIKERSISREKINTVDGIDKNDEELNYSDDFESYESDFETDSSTHSLSKSDPSSTANKDFFDLPAKTYEHGQLTSDESGRIDGSEVIQKPMSEMKGDKEKKFDSGHYDMSSGKTNGNKLSDMSVQFTHPKRDSLEMFSLGASEQPDSGISTCTTSIRESYNKNIMEIIYGGYTNFYTKPIINQRGSELMAKIQLDVLSFNLVDLKPISYDIFMQTFGKLNTNQNFTQTQGNQMNAEQQTEVQETRSIWTQHPSYFDREIAKNLGQNGTYNRHCYGEIINERHAQYLSHCELEQSLDALKQLNNNNKRSKRNFKNDQQRQKPPINYEHLNSFLLRSSLLIDQILGSSNTTTKNTSIQNTADEYDSVLKRACEKSFHIGTNVLDTLQVLKVFASNKHNLIITVHASLPETNVYSSDFSNLLMVWCANTCDKPFRFLTTWSQVSKVEISSDSSDVIVAALRDGSIALWDLRETHSFCSKLDGYLTHFAATQSLLPSWSGDKNNSKLIMDLGACLDVKSFRSQPNTLLTQTTFPRTQFVSLHDSGIVTVWTLVETSEAFVFHLPQIEKYEKLKCSSKFAHTFDYTSPWARVKLTQSAIANIKEYFETKSHHLVTQSRFQKTKTLFQKNIYSDEALKELNQCTSEVGEQGLRFTSLECGSENLFVCTNRSYILMCSKTLKMEKLKRIMINESQFLFPTALKVLGNEQFLAIGLSNGVVMVLNCQSDKSSLATKIIQKPTLSESIANDSIFDYNRIAGKSCAIQNILLNVQKSYEYMDFDHEYRPSTAACITLIDSKKKPFELRVLDQQVIMSGSVLRKNLIQSIELSSDGWYLFALANGHVRIYDFYLDREIAHEESQETGTIIDIAAGKCGYRENNLVILKPNSKVEVHVLNK